MWRPLIKTAITNHVGSNVPLSHEGDASVNPYQAPTTSAARSGGLSPTKHFVLAVTSAIAGLSVAVPGIFYVSSGMNRQPGLASRYATYDPELYLFGVSITPATAQVLAFVAAPALVGYSAFLVYRGVRVGRQNVATPMPDLRRRTLASSPALCPICDFPVRFTILGWPTTRCPDCNNTLGIQIPLKSRMLLVMSAVGLAAGCYAVPLTWAAFVATVMSAVLLFAIGMFTVFHRSGHLVPLQMWVSLSESELQRLRAEHTAGRSRLAESTEEREPE